MNINVHVKRLFDATPVAMTVSRPDGSFEYVNPAFMKLLGYQGEEIYQQDVVVSHPDELETNKYIRSLLNHSPFEPVTIEKSYVHKSGRIIPGLLIAVAQPDQHGKVLRYIAQIIDLSQQKKADADAQLIQWLLQRSNDAMVVVDPKSARIISCNYLAHSRLDYSKEELLNLKVQDINHALPIGQGWDDFVGQVKKNGHIIKAGEHTCRDGTTIPIESNVNYIAQEGQEYLLAVARDISFRKKQEQRIWRQANYDDLTGLPNRRLFQDRLKQAIISDKRSGLKSAVMFIDLDHFKDVNDRLGHQSGDVLLGDTARRISDCLRGTDTIARYGGDEFVLLLCDVDQLDAVRSVAIKIIECLQRPFCLDGETANIGASIGVAISPDDSEDFNQLINGADQAMYQAKEHGGNQFRFFDQRMQSDNIKKALIRQDLISALRQGELHLVYQPVIDLTSGQVVKAEALLRWQHPRLGLLYPKDFIPLAESSGLINEVDLWIFHQVVHQVCRWRQFYSPDFQISINISAEQFKNADLHVKKWPELLQMLHLPANAMALEVSECGIMEPDQLPLELTKSLHNIGVSLYLDDFGTGFSSLLYLKRFAVDCIKLDASLVQLTGQGTDNDSLCEAIISMAHKMSIKVIAEGVETQAQQQFLKENGCDFAQGYLFAKPLSIEGIEKLLEEN